MVLKRYRDVAAALRDPQMCIVGGAVDDGAHRRMREDARRLYSFEKIAEWRPAFAKCAHELAASISGEVELVSGFAEPWSLNVAAIVTDLDPAAARALIPAARIVFQAGAAPGEAIDARVATARLASRFPPSIAALHTQAFVALAVSLPAFLGNAWLALLQNRAEFEWIAGKNATDELLRFAGPSLMQARIRAGERVELILADANRDPDEFPDPDRLDLRRKNSSSHLAFGGGPHACVGGPLVKAAVAAILPVFAERFHEGRLIRFEPYGGQAIRGHRVYVI